MNPKKGNPRGGPATARGRSRSSTNATRHGLRAKGLLLPGEKLRDYRRHLAAFLVALDPLGDAEARLVKGVADAVWSLGRCQRVEHHATLESLESKMMKSGPYLLLHEVREALIGINALIEAIEAVPVPAPGHLTSFVAGCHGCIAPVERMSERPKTLAKFRHAVDELERAGPDDLLATYRAVGDAALHLAGELTHMVKPAETRLNKLRADLAAFSTPDETTARRLARYHGMLTKVASEQLDLISKMREITKRKRAEKKRGSFGTSQKATTTHLLRVVR